VPTHWTRDLVEDGRKFRSWIERQLVGASDVEISALESPSSSGFSNETLLFDLSYREAGAAHRRDLVVRIQPIGYEVVPVYDLGLQFRTMNRLGPTDVPVPKMVWLEEHDTSIFGAPFYVMERVEGRVPPDNPPYHTGGFLTEMSPDERRDLWLNAFEAMAKIHRLDAFATGFGELDHPEKGATGLERQLDDYVRYWEWAALGREHRVPRAAYEFLVKEMSDDDRLGIVWGDARIGNIIFQGTRPAAVIDWEMVTLGSPETDFGWSIFLDRHHSEGIGAPRLEGFPSYEETLDHYQQCAGLEVSHLHYYQVFAGFRFSCVMMRLAQQLVHYEVMDEAAGRAFEENNTVTRLLAALLEIAPPGEGTSGFGAE
jgi:aminoglycoside phosphotransferase (APT) family kinase protein